MEKLWHYAKGGEKHGPITADQLKQLVTTGQLSPDDLVWRENMTEWRKASTVRGLFSNQPPASVPTTGQPKDGVSKTTVPRVVKYGAIGCGGFFVMLLVCSGLLTMIARTVDPEGFANIKAGKNRDGSKIVTTAPVASKSLSSHSPDSSASQKPVEVGTLKEMGEKTYDNLPFANVEQSPDIAPIPLTEDFAKSGTFRFRRIQWDTSKAIMSRTAYENMTTLGYKERSVVSEFSEAFDLSLSEGEPKAILTGSADFIFPIIRIGVMPGGNWEWTNSDVVGAKMIYRYSYRRCVQHNHCHCVMIENGLFTGDGRQVSKKVEWYAEGIGLVKREEYVNFNDGGRRNNITLFSTMHRVVED
ncbi:MAG TPA: DUF4339 domain-containing protein [Planctomycetaceae bacterium]|nr:DUF4339 domain-containing protein [Planctomycetaceae bacterium]